MIVRNEVKESTMVGVVVPEKDSVKILGNMKRDIRISCLDVTRLSSQ